ncbi:MAG: AMP-dependent synthetase and ligase [Actinomycetia bacterium]|nr:AMP-dependent synthetase and ligase [Actinomycetes bacterium]
MWPGKHAQERPDKPALIMAASGEVVTYRELNDGSNRFAQLMFDAGLRFGDHVAVMLENRPEYFEVCWAAQRSGLFYTTINWHFTAEEAAYIIDDCDAEVLVISEAYREIAERLAPMMPKVKVRLMVGDDIAGGYERYADARDRYPAEPLAEELEGTPMLYSSGTTGRPKGIRYLLGREPIGSLPGQMVLLTAIFKMDGDAVYLSPAPLYHSAPLFYCISTQRLGGTVVCMENFDPAEALALIEKHRVTHSQWVPTMFVRMLKLPAAVRNKYDLTSHRCAIHAAAPCPVEVKRKMIEWWGPVIEEYYSATEGMGATYINSEQWLAHPGSVGATLLNPIHILDDDGNEVATGDVGTVWFEPPSNRPGFEYHKDEGKTQEAHDTRGWATVGDVGYLDADGFLYLTDRATFMIVSGGVNIYPQEAENVLINHPKVLDVAVFGIPDDEMGERVHAVVQPGDMADATPELGRELMAYCREHLAHYKCPRSIDFDPELPRQPTGKLYKRLLRDRYWGNKTSRIV